MCPKLLDERLPLFHGQQLAIDTTLVSALGRDGLPCPRCAHVDGATFAITLSSLANKVARASLSLLRVEPGPVRHLLGFQYD